MATTFPRNKRHAASKRLRASNFMRSNPISIPHTASPRKAAELLRACRIQTAPVIDEDGRLIGVVSCSDLFDFCGSGRDRHTNGDSVLNLTNAGIYPGRDHVRSERTVLQIMNPEVFSVRTDASIAKVIKQFVTRGIRRLFVTDRDAMLVGEICIFKLLRKLGKYVNSIHSRQRPYSPST
jgi:predicted transcriptional regulator